MWFLSREEGVRFSEKSGEKAEEREGKKGSGEIIPLEAAVAFLELVMNEIAHFIIKYNLGRSKLIRTATCL
ncbi:hypothetical protein A3I95_03290 [Candidatus Nomurabacteria bacterium RIFCSPLOWO2_02_FULL_44_12]|uniref:Uncharacterized protein n=1 Tax=Candidatus Nomurabacteria bacterium RIFCSPLOWO2_12_FULL_44_11 TaxID=1801796 RepID=A0A1F6Y7M2_9BACT|nr:MAG: hypothetical protein A3E95_03020 [Candidatus Nomurabacteria bacterium RIFCSPHIGHO2_12_FULL_44_22b]OGJ02384.1 MAG: hypothetical protein A3G53_00295 [Candidatus Nomurabacteria bacterium RIFCSPLOWO2_12_FULL_44_11]OGJ07622.1 MAG: hypothetical protein A3I95_03290 [Candidatus Nomurabacteria bacterium RIFCSPLOWO2_02_FULL_44_12]